MYVKKNKATQLRAVTYVFSMQTIQLTFMNAPSCEREGLFDMLVTSTRQSSNLVRQSIDIVVEGSLPLSRYEF